MSADAMRMIAELRELAELTGDERGAQRLAWTDNWASPGHEKVASTITAPPMS